jgi:penicillin-binding protein 1A
VPPAIAILLGVLGGVGIASIINMPKVESLSEFTPGVITRLFDRDGEVFATYAKEKRVLIEEGEVPLLLQNAVLAAEDSNFFQHGGIDAEGVLRAMTQNLRQGRLAMGGSTITMQLARQLYLTPKKTWQRKAEEALLAVELEKKFSKQQILTLYCNLIFMGHGNYGMESAARAYFGKTVQDVDLSEAAVLAGIPQRPSAYSPYKSPDLVITRRDYVLRRMWEEGYIAEEEYRETLDLPLLVVPNRQKDLRAPYFAEEVRRYLETTYGTEGLLEQGLQVDTTLDPAIQAATEEALQQGLVRLDQRQGWRGALHHVESEDLEGYELPSWRDVELQAGRWYEALVTGVSSRSAEVRIGETLLRMDPEGMKWTRHQDPRRVLKTGDVVWVSLSAPEGEEAPLEVVRLEQEPELEGAAIVLESSTGAIRAMVGGWDFDRSSFNRATQAKRQVGSAFKPFVFGAALETGFTPADTIFDAPTVFPGANNVPSYSPRNFYRKYYGITTLRRALEKSMNVCSAKLMDIVGVERTIDFARRCGIRSDLPPYPSLALGSAELIPLELAGAYSAIANQGVYLEPYLIERVRTPDGQQLETHQPRAHKAMEPEIAFVLGHILEGVVDRGTAVRVSRLDLDLAGKTGTTDDYIDAWFVGYTPTYTILTWVGHDVNRSIGRNMTGAEAALPIWQAIVETGLEEGWIAAGSSFSRPPAVVEMQVEYLTGLLPGPGAQSLISEAFVSGTEPARQFDPESVRILQLPWYQQRPFYLPKVGERMPDDVDDWTLVQESWAEEKEEGN